MKYEIYYELKEDQRVMKSMELSFTFILTIKINKYP